MTLSSASILPIGTPLAVAALRTTLFAAGVAVLLRVFKLKATPARLFAWTAVVYLGLCMPIVAWLLHPIPIVVSAWRTSSAISPVQASTSFSERESAPHVFSRLTREAREHSDADASESQVALAPTPGNVWWRLLGRKELALGFYLTVVAFLLTRLLRGAISAKCLVREAKEIEDDRMQPYVADRRSLRIRESSLVVVPITVGIFSPAVLLPANWRTWERAKLHAVMTHEISHVLRHDALSQFASLLHRAVFWFSPLAWWLSRHISQLAEEASDEAALAAGTDRAFYARTLLGFVQAANHSVGRIQWQGVSMAKPGRSEKRLDKVLTWRGPYSMRAHRSLIAIIYAVAVPSIYLAAAARPVPRPQPPQAVAPVAPSAAGLPNLPAAPDVAASGPAVPPSAPRDPLAHLGPLSPARPLAISPVAPASPLGLAASAREDAAQTHRHGFRYGFDDEQRFVIVSGKSEQVTMSGRSEDAQHVEKLRARIPGNFIWFQRDEKSYVIRDQATVDRALQLWAPQEKLGMEQAELGKQQEALGKQQAELGERMRAVRVQVPDLTGEIDKLKAELKALGPNASMEQIGEFQGHIGELQAKMGELQSQSAGDQSKLAAEMSKLGEEQGKLGFQQGDLGRQQGELAEKATKQMKELLDDAIKKGTAQPEPAEAGGASF